MSCPSANLLQEATALVTRNSNTTGLAPYKGILVGNEPQEGVEPDKGENVLDTPNPTPPQSKLPSLILFHRGLGHG